MTGDFGTLGTEPEVEKDRTESEANKAGNEEEKLDELSNTPSVGQPKQNMSRIQAGTPAPMARTALASVLTEVVNC